MTGWLILATTLGFISGAVAMALFIWWVAGDHSDDPWKYRA